MNFEHWLTEFYFFLWKCEKKRNRRCAAKRCWL